MDYNSFKSAYLSEQQALMEGAATEKIELKALSFIYNNLDKKTDRLKAFADDIIKKKERIKNRIDYLRQKIESNKIATPEISDEVLDKKIRQLTIDHDIEQMFKNPQHPGYQKNHLWDITKSGEDSNT